MKKFIQNFLILALLFVMPITLTAQEDTECQGDNVEIVLSITLDYMGEETFWSIHENPDQIPYDGISDPTYVGPEIVSSPPGTYSDGLQGATFFVSICLLPGCYSLVFGDEYGDGMGFTSGHYELYSGDSLLVSGGGNFGSWASDVFCVEDKTPDVLGCIDESACNFYPGATIDDGTCVYPGGPCEHQNPLVVEDHYNENCDCVGTIYYGCTDSTAFNFNQIAAVDDGSCYYNPGCTINFACNYDETADFEDGSCEFLSCQVIGCIDVWASNYDPQANTPDPSLCEYESPSFTVIQSCNEVMIINTTPDAPVQGVGVWGEWQFGDNSFLVSLSDTLYHTYEDNGDYQIVFNYFQGAAPPQSEYGFVMVNDFELEPSIELTNDGLICNTEAEIYSWYRDDILIQQSEESFLSVVEEGIYRCELENVGGCFVVTDDFFVTSIEENSQTQMYVLPTHVQDFLIIGNYDGFVTIFDTKGSIVLEHDTRNQKVMDLSHLGSGMYFIKTKEGDSQKIVKI